MQLKIDGFPNFPKAAEEARLADLLRHASAADQGGGRWNPPTKRSGFETGSFFCFFW